MNRYHELYKKYVHGISTEEEAKELLEAIKLGLLDQDLKEWIDLEFSREAPLGNGNNELREKVFKDIEQVLFKDIHRSSKNKGGILYFALSAAACLIGLLFLFNYRAELWEYFSTDSLTQVEYPYVAISQVVNENAILLKSEDGTQVFNLSDSLEYEKNTPVLLSPESGQLIYRMKAIVSGKSDKTHVLSVPNGKNICVELEDGTLVWLNAGSELKFPADLMGKAKRQVELKGEAYFKVKSDVDRPFEVSSGAQRTTVLGTEFNVKAYSGDPVIETTLINGSVKVSVNAASMVLEPGSQSKFTGYNKSFEKDFVDVGRYIAWKENQFYFQGDDMNEISKVLSRWYGVPFHVHENTKGNRFSGKISRTRSLEDVLSILSKTNDIKTKIIEEYNTKIVVITL